MSIRLATPGQRTTPKASGRSRSRCGTGPRRRARRHHAHRRGAVAQRRCDRDVHRARWADARSSSKCVSITDSDASTDKVVNCLLDDEFSSWSLRRICAYAGITVADLFASYKKALFAQAHIEAAHLITSKLPPIVADVMQRALPQPIECPRCHGTPTTPGTTPCPICLGSGTDAERTGSRSAEAGARTRPTDRAQGGHHGPAERRSPPAPPRCSRTRPGAWSSCSRRSASCSSRPTGDARRRPRWPSLMSRRRSPWTRNPRAAMPDHLSP